MAVRRPRVPREWREKNLLVPAQIELAEVATGWLADIDDLVLRRELERRLAGDLVALGLSHLDVSDLRSKNRSITKKVSRLLHDQGAAGIAYRSNIDDQPCAALFEGRAWLVPAGSPQPLDGPVPDLERVCREFGLEID